MNKHILKSMHVLDTLGLNKDLKSGGVDGFMTGVPVMAVAILVFGFD